MPFVTRNKQGTVNKLSRVAEYDEQEYLPSNHVDIRQFLYNDSDNIDDPRLALDESDKDIARITEDLIHLLVQKNTILFTELPEAVQKKILAREAFRSMINGDVSNFLDEEGGF